MGKETLKTVPPQTIEEALSQIAGLSDTNKAQETTIKEQSSEIESLGGQVSKQGEQISALTEKNKTQAETIKDQSNLIDELSDKIEKLEGKVARGSSAPTVVVNKKTYAVMASVKHKGETFSPAAVAANEALCKELLAIDGQTILIEEV